MNPITATLYPYPEGWYAIGFSEDFPKGEIRTQKFMGKEVIVWRTESGKIAVSDPYCPHLGAHIGKGGKVVGEDIRCPFHGFCFDTSGTCTSTGYGTNPNPKGKLQVQHTTEVNGIVMVYHHPDGIDPDWFIPKLDMGNFTKLRHVCWELDSHPQETTENGVDIGHFTIVHGYTGVEELESAQMDGPYYTAKYAMNRVANFVGLSKTIRAEFTVHVHGLGYSFVDVYVPEMGIHNYQFVLSTPIAPGKIQLRVAVAVEYLEKPSKANFFLGLFPRKMATELVAQGVYKGFMHDVGQDFDIWSNKKYVHPPALAKGDGPVGQYRVWAKQFYPNKKEILEPVAGY